MKKLILVLVLVLVVSPVFATVTLTESGKTGTTVTVGYNYNSSGGFPRAFALNLVPAGGTITSVTPAITGESTSSNKGYGIFPGSIVIDESGAVTSPGSPVAPVGSCGAGPALPGASSAVVELGALYVLKAGDGDANKPANSGALFTVVCSAGTTSLTVSEEESCRGGVVDTTANGLVVAPITIAFTCSPQPVAATTPTPAHNAVGVVAKLLPTPTYPTLSWTPAAGGTNPKYDVYFGTVATPVTVVSPNQTATSYVATGAVQGKTYYWKIVSKNDCNSVGVSSAIWTFNTDCLKSTDVGYAAWVGGGVLPWAKPSCWCYQRQCRGDLNGTQQTPYWVYTQDLTILKDAYGKLDAALTGNRICADINHTKQTPYRVYTQDLTVLKAYYGKLAAATPVCPVANVNFWTN